VGGVSTPAIFLILPVTIFLLLKKNRYEEIFIGFWFILILSDNLLIPSLGFAKSLKNVYIVLLAAIVFFKREEFAPLTYLHQRFIPFYLIAIISLFYSQTIGVSIQKTLSYILLFIAVPNFVTKLYRDEGVYFFKRLAYFFLLLLTISIGMKYISPDMAVSHGGRLTGIFGNPNGMGLFAVLVFLLFYLLTEYYPALFNKNEKRAFYFIILICVVFSGSRNASLSVVLFLFMARFYKISPFLGFISLLVVLFISEFITQNYVAIIGALGLESFFRLETLEEGGGRYIAWNFAWQQIQDSFFIGRGFAFDEYIMRKNFEFLSQMGHEGGVHNTYLILWLNTGLIGLLLFFYGFISSFVKAAKNTRLAFPIMYCIMFTIMFEPWLAASLNPLTIIFLIIITIIMNKEFKEPEINLPLSQ
jgi:O-antigen ligase